MSEIQQLLSTLIRPGLLVRAARHTLTGYERASFLRRILGEETLPSPTKAARKLLAIEQYYEEMRLASDAAYSVQRHIEVLGALMSEARLLRAEIARDQTNASATASFLRAV